MSGNGSRTTTENSETNTEARPILHLRNKKTGKKKPSNNVRWTDDVVDNENMDKKKSKICCIFHPQREFGELSSDSSDSSSDESDKSDDEMREASGLNGQGAHGADVHRCAKHGRKQKKPRNSSPNAYEKQPKPKNK